MELTKGDAQLKKQLHQALGIKPNQLQSLFTSAKKARKQPPTMVVTPTKKQKTSQGSKGPFFCR